MRQYLTGYIKTMPQNDFLETEVRIGYFAGNNA